MSFSKSTFNDIMRFTYLTMDEIMENTADTTQPTDTGFQHTEWCFYLQRVVLFDSLSIKT